MLLLEETFAHSCPQSISHGRLPVQVRHPWRAPLVLLGGGAASILIIVQGTTALLRKIKRRRDKEWG